MTNIVIAPNPILNTVSREIEDPTSPDIRKLACEMEEVMYSTDGCGLAAPQIGQNIRLIVADCQWSETGDHDPVYMVNPKIIALSEETENSFEGCISVPGLVIKLDRAIEAEIQYMDLDGQEHTMDAEGLWARCLQHEIDHLNGITMLDKLKGMKKIQAIGAYRKALEKGAKPGSEPICSI